MSAEDKKNVIEQKNIVSTALGSVCIFIICKTVYIEKLGQIGNTIGIIILSAIVYLGVLILLKNPIIENGKKLLKRAPT